MSILPLGGGESYLLEVSDGQFAPGSLGLAADGWSVSPLGARCLLPRNGEIPICQNGIAPDGLSDSAPPAGDKLCRFRQNDGRFWASNVNSGPRGNIGTRLA
ncbi:MAG: hypothetical protein KDA60_15030 [Planctomycetales bacterium]|nr:hypothetical protein [Planctomycetales bacterium]